MPEENYRDLSFKQWIMQPESMIGISAVILSLCGLFISFYEASLIREYQRASVWPHVEIGPSFQTNSVSFHIRNTGIGPARIKAANVSYKENVVEDWEELIKQVLADENIDDIPEGISGFRSYINRKVVPPTSNRQSIFKMYLSDTANTTNGRQFLQVLRNEVEAGNINITVCYCSVYDQCWVSEMIETEVNNKILKPGGSRKVENCENVPTSDI